MKNQSFSNLTYIESTDSIDILSKLEELGVKGAHFTNGIYAMEAKLVVPTILAGFKHIVDLAQNGSPLPIIVAVNSDKSIQQLGKEGFEPQNIRSRKVAEPLAQMFPDNKIIIIYYDETTPNELYTTLQKYGHTRTLHKWGYGTNPEVPKIEGAECFESVYAFPLPNDIKPICWGETPCEAQNNILVRDLRGTLIDKNGVLFELPNALKYCESTSIKPSIVLATSSSLGM